MITVFATGGTFDKIYFDANSEFSVGDPQAGPLLVEARTSIDYEIKSLIKKDSLDMTDEDRELIAAAVLKSSNQKILITHGTDGMVASANALATKDLGEQVVVFLGAMQPARMRYSDASFNLGFAFAAVQLLEPGIYIAMNGQVFPYDAVQKNLSVGRFESARPK